ncbi:hypothetical protein D3C81_1824560 [compost metagenome]
MGSAGRITKQSSCIGVKTRVIPDMVTVLHGWMTLDLLRVINGKDRNQQRMAARAFRMSTVELNPEIG